MLRMILVGLLVGVMAKLLMPGRDPGGVVITILIGIGGSVVAGFLGRFIGWYGDGGPAGFIASVLGAIVLLLVYRALRDAEGSERAALQEPPSRLSPPLRSSRKQTLGVLYQSETP